MKFLALILALMTLVLSSVPCSDGANEGSTIQAESHSDNHSESDECSPFCACACCGTAFSFEVSIFEDESVNALCVSHLFSHKNLFTQGYITSIWHPPAIA